MKEKYFIYEKRSGRYMPSSRLYKGNDDFQVREDWRPTGNLYGYETIEELKNTASFKFRLQEIAEEKEIGDDCDYQTKTEIKICKTIEVENYL